MGVGFRSGFSRSSGMRTPARAFGNDRRPQNPHQFRFEFRDSVDRAAFRCAKQRLLSNRRDANGCVNRNEERTRLRRLQFKELVRFDIRGKSKETVEVEHRKNTAADRRYACDGAPPAAGASTVR